ncbi:beta-ketoacyl synthase N-terminal-like domain-containing protein [Streptomyces sp. NPDC093591]|uniref:beta-ketoacyl synthase N-terminal-like domain-containing protein n=1 Tax=Streptomyces sp. NPDC093591 TaxID=3366044 RepID=UPI00381EF392
MTTEQVAPQDLDSAVAVVGMSGRFPGARDLETYWANLRDGLCSISTFTEKELLADGADAAELSSPAYVGAQGRLPDADRFEAELFGFNRTEAAALDPQHRVLLETAWSALEDAGHAPLTAPSAAAAAGPSRTGVYVGGSPTEHALAAGTDPALAASIGALQVRILTDREFLAPWISYRLGLDGPSMTVQTACSTSLTAVHLAVQALLLGECDMALAGGVAIGTVRKQGYVHYQGGIFSPDGRCRPFDKKAAGTVPGSGVGVLVLRRLADALADGDPVRAVIRGSAVTNDGSGKVGFTAPGVDQQSAAITEAWAAAGLEPSAAQYVEAHGTGTELGDRIELEAASAAFAGGAGIGLGSVKSNIGHADAAAGAAALIKTILMLEHATLAPTVDVTSPVAALRGSPLRLVTEAEKWPGRAGLPRLAGVTSVGIGGTNVHVVVEEAPARPAPADDAVRPLLLPLSARTEPQLSAAAERLAAVLRAPGAPSLADVAHTLRTGRVALAVRAYVVASDAAEAAEKLTALARGRAPHGTPDPLGEAWVRGEEVTWPVSGGNVRKVHLPTYPFAGESHGALTLRKSTAQGTEEAPEEAPEETTPEGGELEATVAALVIEALDLNSAADLAQTYFEAGGDSLTAVHLAGRLRDELGIDVPIQLFLEPITLKDMTSSICEMKRNGDADGALDALLAEFEAES